VVGVGVFFPFLKKGFFEAFFNLFFRSFSPT